MSDNVVVQAQEVTRRFGGVTAVDRLSLAVHSGDVLGIMGPNGAGKSTFLSLVAGTYRPSAGRLVVCGQDMGSAGRSQGARVGVGLAHQIPKPFKKLTVRQNLVVAAQIVPGRARRRQIVHDSLGQTGLDTKAELPAAALGLLDLKRLGLARALALDPKLLLLDEVAAGLAGSDLELVIQLLQKLRDPSRSMILVEHVQDVIHEVADRVVAMEWGRVIAEGTPAQVSRDARVVESYLGTAGRLVERPARPQTLREPVLTVAGLTVDYGQVRALEGVDLEVRPGEVLAVLGANGAGKTTLAKALQGLVRPTAGRITVGGADVTRKSSDQRLAHGFALCPEGRRLFGPLTVRENLELGTVRGGDPAAVDRVFTLFPELVRLTDRQTGALSGGEQQMVAIGRALASSPSVVVFDELSLGLAPVLLDRLFDAVRTIAANGTAVVLIEQNVHRARALAHDVLLLRRGRQVYSGPADGLTEEQFQDAYLGVETQAAGESTSLAEQEQGQ